MHEGSHHITFGATARRIICLLGRSTHHIVLSLHDSVRGRRARPNEIVEMLGSVRVMHDIGVHSLATRCKCKGGARVVYLALDYLATCRKQPTKNCNLIFHDTWKVIFVVTGAANPAYERRKLGLQLENLCSSLLA